LSEDDDTAKQKLDQINKESVSHSHELASVDAALATARRKLEAAQQHEAKAADRAKAAELRKCLAKFIDAGKDCDSALELLVGASQDMRDALTQMNRLGCTHPSHAQLDSLGAIALRTALTANAWSRYFERVSPVERKTFAALVAAWAAMVERNVSALLTSDTEAA
jgi:hypothetical protein